MQLLTGYAKPITALAVSPGGEWLYSVAHGQQMIWVWDLASGEVEEKLRGPHTRHGIGALAASPCGGWLVSVDNYTAVAGWQLPDRVQKRTWYVYSKRKAVAIHPKGQLVATPLGRTEGRSGCGFQLTDLETRKTVASPRGHAGEVSGIAFSADGKTLATGSADRTVRLWNVKSREELRTLTHKLVPNKVAFRPDGKCLASAAAKLVFTWNVSDGELTQTLSGHDGTVTDLAYSPDGKYLASAGADGVVIVRDANTHEVVGQRHLDIGKIGALVWRPDSSGVIAGGDKLIAVCALGDLLALDTGAMRTARNSQAPAVQLKGHTKKVVGLAYSPNGKTLASWPSRDGEIRLWDFSNGAGLAKEVLAFTPKYGDVRDLTWSADGRRLALSLANMSRAELYSAGTGKSVRTIKEAANWYSQYEFYLAYTPGGRLLLASGDRQLVLELFDAEGKKKLIRAKTSADPNYGTKHAIAGPKDRNIYVRAGRAGVVRWTPATKSVEVVGRAEGGNMTLGPDERLLATTGGNSAFVWDLPDGHQRLELKHQLSTSGVAFVSEGRLLTTCYDGSVRLWDLTSGAELRQLALGMGKIYCLAVAPDGLTFAVGVEKKNGIAILDLPD